MSDLPYERTAPRAFTWTDTAFGLLESGDLRGEVHRRGGLEVAVVAGACPRCGHDFRYEAAEQAVVGGRGVLESTGTTLDPSAYVPVDVACTCTGAHEGRLDGERGCGIRFRVEVRPDVHDD